MLSLLGWNPGTTKEIFSLEELIKEFSLERVGKSGAKFDFDKTKWFNQQYLRNKDDFDLADELIPLLKEQGFSPEKKFVVRVCNELKERATFVSDMLNEGRYFFEAPTNYDEKTVRKKWKENTPEILEALKARLLNLDEFTSNKIQLEFQGILAQFNIGMGQLLPQFRLALTGIGMGPSLFNISEIIGKKETLTRIETAINNI